MLKRTVAFVTAVLFVVSFITVAYAKKNIDPHLEINDSQLVFSLEGKSEHIYIIRIVLKFDSSAGLGKISSYDGGIIKYNCKNNQAVILYFDRGGKSLNGKKDYVTIDLTNGSYGSFYVSKCEIVEKEQSITTLACSDKVTVNKKAPVQSGYSKKLRQSGGEDAQLDVTKEGSLPQLDLPLYEDTDTAATEVISSTEPESDNNRSDNTPFILVCGMIVIIMLIFITNHAYKQGRKSAMKNNMDKYAEMYGSGETEEQTGCSEE
ncbi:MAG: hypothetical protein K6F76_04370 [Clostridiales bacterium]|nr:hypothetical protein [Clostridiales bacterium]